MEKICKNCGQELAGKYCSQCGQAADTHDINYKHLWHEIQHGIFHIDKGILFTTKELFTRPGYAIQDYISGKRAKHFKPFAYVFILSTLFAVLAHYYGIKTFLVNISTSLNSGMEQTADFKNDKIVQIISNTTNWFRDHYAYGILLLLPFISFATYLAFRKSKLNYLQHLILNTYIAGQRTVVFIIFLFLTVLLKDVFPISKIKDAETLTWVILMTWTYLQFFNDNKIIKTIALTLKTYLYLVVQLIIISIVVGSCLYFFVK